jgi:peroxiredoxin
LDRRISVKIAGAFEGGFMRQVRTLFLAGILSAAVVSLSFAMGNPGVINETIIGKPATDFTLNTLKEKNVNMTKYRDGKKAIIFFWATWCPHCRVELKRLSEMQDELTSKGIKIILVSLGEEKETVQEYINRHQYTFDVFLDDKQSLESSYQLVGVPTLFFIDEKGAVKYVDHALPDNYEEPFKSTN